jgi:hemolysin type calcium-binding protein
LFRGLSSTAFVLAAAIAAIVVVPGSSARELTAAPAESCAAAPCFVSVTKIGSGTGRVTSEPAGLDCGSTCFLVTDEFASMTLVASPASGSVFTGWAGDCRAVSGNRCELYFDTAKEMTAIFDLVGSSPTVPPLGPPAPAADPTVRDHPPVGSRCTIVGSARGEVLRGTPGQDVICGRGGNDTIYGGEGHDLVIGGYGNDRLNGQGGREYVVGGPGADVLRGGGRDDELFGGRGADVLFARDGVPDLVHGGPGRDRARADRVDGLRAVERRF